MTSRPDLLVVGANGYVGQNAALALSGTSTVLTSRGDPNDFCRQSGLPFIRANLEESIEPLVDCRPREVWLMARPNTGLLEPNLSFTSNVKRLLETYSRRLHLKRLVFFSTQLVYATPSSAEPIESSALLGPQGLYECQKLDLEYYLRWLVSSVGLASALICRLPLLAGARVSSVQRGEQILYRYFDAHDGGCTWPSVPRSEPPYGNSWADVADLIARLRSYEFQRGVETRNVASGHARYAEFAQACQAQRPAARRAELELLRTTFYLKDELGMPPRSLAELLSRLSSRPGAT